MLQVYDFLSYNVLIMFICTGDNVSIFALLHSAILDIAVGTLNGRLVIHHETALIVYFL